VPGAQSVPDFQVHVQLPIPSDFVPAGQSAEAGVTPKIKIAKNKMAL